MKSLNGIYKGIFVLMTSLISWSAFAQPAEGTIAPNIELADVGGNTISLASLKGKVVLIDFWASWCGPCRVANHKIQPVYQKYKEDGFEIFGISVDTNLEAWKKAIAADKINWLQVNDPGNWESATAKKWNIEQLPTSFLLDKEGKVVATDPEIDQLKKLLPKLLKK